MSKRVAVVGKMGPAFQHQTGAGFDAVGTFVYSPSYGAEIGIGATETPIYSEAAYSSNPISEAFYRIADFCDEADAAAFVGCTS